MIQTEQLHGTHQITTQERERRLAAVRYAVASVRIEGLNVSQRVEKIYQCYAAGDLTKNERRKMVLQAKAI